MNILAKTIAALVATVLITWAGPAHASQMCDGTVTEVTVTSTNDLGFRHTGMSSNNGSFWITACNLESDGAYCEAWHKLLTAAVLSGRTTTVKANICKTSTTASPIVRYIKLRD